MGKPQTTMNESMSLGYILPYIEEQRRGFPKKENQYSHFLTRRTSFCCFLTVNKKKIILEVAEKLEVKVYV